MNPRLEVDRQEFAGAIKPMVRLLTKKQQAEAIISFNDGRLSIAHGGVEVSAPARGGWPGQARISGQFIVAVAKLLPPGDPIVLTVEGGKMRLATTSTTCTWQPESTNRIELPMEPPLTMILNLPLKYSATEIANSGLTRIVQKAEERKTNLVNKAAKVLGPLGVKPTDLLPVVTACIRRNES